MSGLLTSSDICKITGLALGTFKEWCDKGIVVPDKGGEGSGSLRRFTPLQVVGIAVAVELRNGERGCVLSYVGKVVSAFASMSEKKLLAEFESGCTHFLMIHDKSVILDSQRYDGMPDVRKIYDEVMGLVEERELINS